MKILALEKDIPNVNEKAFTKELLKKEAARAWEIHQSGIIRELYFRKEAPYAVLVLECNDKEEAESVLASLPLVKNGLIAFDVIPLIPYDGFARLFTDYTDSAE